MNVWTALGLLLAYAPDDPAARELFESIRDRCLQAKTLRIEFEAWGDGPKPYTSSGVVMVKGKDRFVAEARMKSGSEGEKTSRVVSDGRKSVGTGIDGQTLDWTMSPGEMALETRRQAATGGYSRIWSLHGAGGNEPRPEPRVSAFRSRGVVQIGGRETRLIEYTLEYPWEGLEGRPFEVTMSVDLATRLPVARVITSGGVVWINSRLKFELDPEIPDREFSYPTKRGLAGAVLGLVAEQVRLYARFIGRYPRSLDDLARRPADLEPEVFWPEGGFVLGGRVPVDPWGHPFEFSRKDLCATIACLGAKLSVELPCSTCRPVGAPSDRLRKQYTAKVQVALLAAAVRAYRDTYAELPRKKSVLWERPEGSDVWPDGGFIPGQAVPADPWGRPYRIISDPSRVRVQVRDAHENVLAAKSLLDPERGALEELSRPRLSGDERRRVARLLDLLGEDDLEAREKAEGALRAWGPSAAGLIDERLKGEKDPEVAGRLRAVRKAVPSGRPAWQSELGVLSVTVGAGAQGPMGDQVSKERTASVLLKTLASAEADFRGNDRDRNGVQDFWTGDVSGLYTLVPAGDKESIKLIALPLAAADGAPLEDGAEIERFAERQPHEGYWFRAMEKDASQSPAEEYQKDATGKGPGTRNPSRFGFCCYPAEYGVTGRRTFIINENNTVWSKDTQGEPVLEWPSDAELSAGWSRAE